MQVAHKIPKYLKGSPYFLFSTNTEVQLQDLCDLFRM